MILALTATVLGFGLVAATASALPPVCKVGDPDCGGGDGGGTFIERGTRALTVTRTAGTVVGGAIDCGTTCTDTKAVQHNCVDWECGDWPAASTWSLTATGGASGYSASWSANSGCAVGPTCVVRVGDVSTGTASKTVAVSWVDTTKPLTPTFNPPAEIGPGGSVSASAFDNSGSIGRYVWRVDNVVQATTGSVLALGGFAHGVHSVAVSARDAAGNESDVVSRTVAVDKVVTVTPGAIPALTNAATVPLPFATDSDVVSSKCILDGAAPGTDCTTNSWSGVTAGSPDGTYTYTVAVTDNVGNTATSTPRTVVIDRTAPALAFTDGPTEGQQVVTSNAAITFSLTDAHPGTVECRLDGVVVACAPDTAVAFADLANGQHTFSIKAVDEALNERTATRTFAVQVAGPTGVTTGGTPAAPTVGGTSGGGITGGTTGGTTGGGPAAAVFDPRISSRYVWKGRRTKFGVLSIKRLPARAKVVVTCKGKRKGCPVKRKSIKVRAGKLNLLKVKRLKTLKKLRLKAGAVLQVTVTGPSGDVKVARWVVRRGKSPRFSVRCAAPGGKLKAC